MSNIRKAITWNRVRLEELRAGYNEAVEKRSRVFRLKISGQGTHDFEIAYAKYLLEWLDGEFKAAVEQPRQPYNEGEEGQ